MAYGQVLTTVAFPQPGTSNLPYPVRVGRTTLPAFIPVVTTVVDTYGAAVIAQTVELDIEFGPAGAAVPGTVIAALIQINANLAKMADERQALEKALNDLNIATLVRCAALADENATLAIRAAALVEANNFAKALSPNTPVMPNFIEQIKTAVENGISLNTISSRNAMVTNFINSTVTSAGAMITGTSTYQTVATWVSGIKDSILAVLPPSLQSTASKIKAGGL